jgi:hypothetical protein
MVDNGEKIKAGKVLVKNSTSFLNQILQEVYQELQSVLSS